MQHATKPLKYNMGNCLLKPFSNDFYKCYFCSCISGYVQQDDLFFGTLTVIEHLTFQVGLAKGNSLIDHLTKDFGPVQMILEFPI
jgi:hypothetical protein